MAESANKRFLACEIIHLGAASRILEISSVCVIKGVRQGRFPGMRSGDGKYLFLQSEIEELAKTRKADRRAKMLDVKRRVKAQEDERRAKARKREVNKRKVRLRGNQPAPPKFAAA